MFVFKPGRFEEARFLRRWGSNCGYDCFMILLNNWQGVTPCSG